MSAPKKIFLFSILLASLGLLSIYSSTYQKATFHWKTQIIWLLLGLVVFLCLSRFNYRWLWDATYFLYFFSILLLGLVLIFGNVRLGAQRWLKVAWFNLQPSELAKLAAVIFLARYYSKRAYQALQPAAPTWGIWRGLIVPFLFILIPVGLIIEQPDLGSAILVILIFMSMLFLARVRKRYIVIFLFCASLCLPLGWHFLHDYQRDRLKVFLNPNIDPLGAGYTLIQSKVAIGSGGLWGKGWLSGTQSQLHFLPESHTDFIFATFAEEWGFLGSVLALLLYYLLIREGMRTAKYAQENFSRLLASGISFMLAAQVFINIAMTMGLMPIVGLPLPLMSYGGSSMVVTFAALGILVSIERRNIS